MGSRPAHPNDGLSCQFSLDRDPFRVFSSRIIRVDSLVTESVASILAPIIAGRFALVAVGGYGRRELFPFSDVDLLLLFESEADLANVKEPVSEFLRSLWDTGLRVSHSVRTVAECCRLHEQNTELHISLLDRRFLCSDFELFELLSKKLSVFEQRHGATIIRNLAELARNRHLKFNNTVYHLEPNIKEAPGGLRDIHLLHWLSQLAPHHQAIREAVGELDAAKRFIYALRCFLHFQAGRDYNLLSFEFQDEVAQRLASPPIDAAEWMRLYFQHARPIFQSSLRALEYVDAQNAPLFQQFRNWRSRVSSAEFTISRERILLRNPAQTLQSVESVLALFTFAARHGMQLAWDTQRRIRAVLTALETFFREKSPSWLAWREFFAQPHAALALQEMQETGLLAAAIPEWQSIDSLVVRDFYHRYTVDEHTLIAIQAIDDLLASAPGTPPRFQQLVLEEDDPATLRLALLLHDIGKASRPGDHVRGSLESAQSVLRRLSVPEIEAGSIRFLIEHHLDLSLVMTGRDLDDPATSRFLASRVGTQERLRRLTLLTYADITAVNPTAMTPWRLEQLWRVYLTASEQLTRELASDRVQAATASSTNTSPEVARFVEGLPTRYLRTHTREQIEHHFELHQQANSKGFAVEIERSADAYLMTVLAEDQPGLFASLCGALASFGMNIVKAEAASNSNGRILDFIRFVDPSRTLELNPGELEDLKRTVESVLMGSARVTDLLQRKRALRRPKGQTKIAPAIRFINDASDLSTLIDFVGEDRPGLLYDLSSTLSAAGCNIEVVMIDTEANKAIDVFYVTKNGGKLDPATQDRLQSDLTRAGACT